jgi:hypothetical protein
MHIYAITERDAGERDPIAFKATLREAQAHGKEHWPPTFRPCVRILLTEVKTNKESLVWLLNNPSGLTPALLTEGALRKWKLTARGGLKEIKE